MIDWPTPDQVQYWSSVVTVVGLPIAVFAFLAAWRQLSLSKRSGSVTALITLHEALRKCWNDYFAESDPSKENLAFGDLCNTLEVACAAFADRTLFGESARVLESYLVHSLHMIEQHEETRVKLVAFLQDETTFSNISGFLRSHRRLLERQRKVNETNLEDFQIEEAADGAKNPPA